MPIGREQRNDDGRLPVGETAVGRERLLAAVSSGGRRACTVQNAASGTSISALSVFSTMARSEVSRGSTWVAKKRVAASLPS